MPLLRGETDYYGMYVGEVLWIRQPTNMTVTVGSDVLIPCEYSGVGSLPPFWRHNEYTFYSLYLPSAKYSFNRSGLTIHNITLAMNMDRYSCYIELFNGNVESTIGVITVIQKVQSSVTVTVVEGI